MLPQNSTLNLDQTKLALLLVADWQLEQVTSLPISPVHRKDTTVFTSPNIPERLVKYTLWHQSYPQEEAWAHCIEKEKDALLHGVPRVIAMTRSAKEIAAMAWDRSTFEGYYKRYYRPECFPPIRFDKGDGRGPEPNGAIWYLDHPLHHHPIRALSTLPSVEIPRGLCIIHQILMDLDQILCGEAIEYLAMYTRDLIRENVVYELPSSQFKADVKVRCEDVYAVFTRELKEKAVDRVREVKFRDARVREQMMGDYQAAMGLDRRNTVLSGADGGSGSFNWIRSLRNWAQGRLSMPWGKALALVGRWSRNVKASFGMSRRYEHKEEVEEHITQSASSAVGGCRLDA